MNYYDKKKGKLFKKAHGKYHNGGGKERAVKYYQKNKEKIKKRGRYNAMTNIKRREKIQKSLDRYYKLKAQYKE